MPLAHIFFLLDRNNHITEVEAQTATERHAVTEILDIVEELCGACHTTGLDDIGYDSAERLL